MLYISKSQRSERHPTNIPKLESSERPGNLQQENVLRQYDDVMRCVLIWYEMLWQHKTYMGWYSMTCHDMVRVWYGVIRDDMVG